MAKSQSQTFSHWLFVNSGDKRVLAVKWHVSKQKFDLIFSRNSSGHVVTARFVEDKTRNGHRNGKRIPNRNQETTYVSFRIFK